MICSSPYFRAILFKVPSLVACHNAYSFALETHCLTLLISEPIFLAIS
jgi:hypothetical protein